MILVVGWIVMAVVLAGCFSAELAQPHRFSENPVEIIGNFSLGKEKGGNGYSVAMTQRPSTRNNAAYVVLISNVSLLGWNDDFIVAETPLASDASSEWYLVVVSTRQVYHCAERLKELSEKTSATEACSSLEQFVELKTKLGVPGDFVLQNSTEVYERLKPH